ncbi:MAG TPA: ATP-binding protein [Methylomirabilota bacterium]
MPVPLIRGVLLALALWLGSGVTTALGAERAPAAGATGPAEIEAVKNVLWLSVAPRMGPALLTHEQMFRATLKAGLPEGVTVHAEYLEMTLIDDETLENDVVAYFTAKYARKKLDLVTVVNSRGLRFVLRHRARLFPGVPVVFGAVDRRAAADITLPPDVSGVWLQPDWTGTLDAARRLQPDLEHVVVVSGASAVDRGWEATARAQLEPVRGSLPVSYLGGLSIEAVTERAAALPARTAILFGVFLRDGAGRDFAAPEVATRLARAARVPVYVVNELDMGGGAVGGHVISWEGQGRRQAEIGTRMLRGERPAPDTTGMNTYRFDARQLRRLNLDPRNLPPGSIVLFDEPSLWQLYRGYIVGAVIVLALQSWLIVGLLASRAQRRRAQAAVAEQLRFETLVSRVLTELIKMPGGADSSVERALALIGAELDVDRIVLAERNEERRAADVAHAWIRDGIAPLPTSFEWSAFPWLSRRLGENQVALVTPRHPLPPEAEIDRRTTHALGMRSLLAVPLILEDRVVGVLSFSTLRDAREWPDVLIDRCRLLAEVLANTIARRRAEARVLAGEERYRRQREELAHALRVNTLGEFGVSLAHEINQPLTAIALNARALARLLEDGLSEREAAAETLSDINADALRAGAIIARLRALSRREHSPRAGLDLDALIDDMVDLARPDLALKGIALHRASTRRLPPVSGDPIQLQQVFLNLLTNAGEAIGRGAGAERRITVGSRHPAPSLVEVTVSDTGVGAADLDLERMFESFVTSKPGGLGMGLAISRSIVEAHGGRIYAKANGERGLTMHVELPAQPGAV